MRRMPLVFIWMLLIALLSSCIAAPAAPAPAEADASTPAPVEEGTAVEASGELIVFAAASLTDAFTQIGTDFQAANPDTHISFNFAGSQQLAQQLGQGAPADVFASANARQMEVAIEESRVISGTQRTFVRNRLVVITPADNPAEINTLQDLTKPGIKLVLAAAEVPVGAYSIDFLTKASASIDFGETFSQTVIANVVSYEENVRSVLSKVVLGEADAGIVYTSDIAQDASQVNRIDIPDELNTIAAYPIAPIADAENPDLAQLFFNYVLGPDGQTVLADYGFIPTIGTATGEQPQAAPLVISGAVATPTTFTPDELSALEQVEIQATNRDGVEQTYTGILLTTLLEQVGLNADATSVVFVGGDGYTAELSLADLNADPDVVIAIEEAGSLRNVIPTQAPRTWVKGLVEIQVK